MVTPRKRVVKAEPSHPMITEEDRAIFKEIVKFEAAAGKPWWTFAYPKETWVSFKKRGCPTTNDRTVESTMPKQTKIFDAKQAATRISGHLQDAVGDIASDMLSGSGGFNDDKWDKKIKKAKKAKVQDLHGWLADELYNDPDTIQDMIGDKLYEECEGDKLKQLEVLFILRSNAHTGMQQACDAMESQVRS